MTPALVRKLAEARVDPVLFRLSYDYVGDLAEPVALIWPGSGDQEQPIRLADVVDALTGASRTEVPTLLSAWLDSLDPAGRWAETFGGGYPYAWDAFVGHGIRYDRGAFEAAIATSNGVNPLPLWIHELN